jgi:choline dehydrogenase-like flavoprotein
MTDYDVVIIGGGFAGATVARELRHKGLGVLILGRAPALHRLYRATASKHWVLDPAGHPIHGRTVDHRTPVTIEGSFPQP